MLQNPIMDLQNPGKLQPRQLEYFRALKNGKAPTSSWPLTGQTPITEAQLLYITHPKFYENLQLLEDPVLLELYSKKFSENLLSKNEKPIDKYGSQQKSGVS